MENKEIATVKKITGELIGGFFLYGILFAILYSFLFAMILTVISTESLIITAIIAILLQGLSVYFVWKFSISATFKKRAIDKNDVPVVIRNLMIFTVIICFISAIINFIDVNKNIDKTVNSSSSLQLSESLMKYKYTDEEISQYTAKKEKIINEAKSRLYTYLIVLEIGLFVVYLGVVPLQKKTISKHAV